MVPPTAAATRTPQEVQNAWDELKQCLLNTSLQDAHNQQSMATDMYEQEEKKQQQQKEVKQRGGKTETRKSETKRASRISNKSQSRPQVSNTKSTPTSTPFMIHSDWSFAIEEMPNISRYSVTLRRVKSISATIDATQLKVTMNYSDAKDSTRVTLTNHRDKIVLFQAVFPVRLVNATAGLVVLDDDDGMISLRLQSETPLLPTPRSIVPTRTLEGISCRFCHQSLCSAAEIEKIVPLPSVDWSEVADYLVCYNGPLAVDFGSVKLERGVAMEDSTVFVLHREDVGESVAVLALEGYGTAWEASKEQSVESNDESVPLELQDAGGSAATVCCSQCCSVLGCTPLQDTDKIRFLKHRLSYEKQSRCASFVAQEMIRYAESKAIFTFAIIDNGVQHSNSNCLILKILSWDAQMAVSSRGNGVLDFQNVVKVIYEVTSSAAALSSHKQADSPWFLAGGTVDFCCLPNMGGPSTAQESNKNTSSMVTLYLDSEEWAEVKQTVTDGSSFFSKAVADTTIRFKVGAMATASRSLGMSALFLQ